MRVLVDATAIPANLAGVGRYVGEILPALSNLGVSLHIATQGYNENLFAQAVPRARLTVVSERLVSRPLRLAWEQTGLPRLVARAKPDLLFSPHYTMPALGRTPVTVCLHDATFFSLPEVHERAKRYFFKAAIAAAVRRADSLVVPSHATAREVMQYTGAGPERFTVAHHGVDRSLFYPVSAQEQERVRASLGVGAEGYVAFLGTLEPRKNIGALIRAWEQAFGDWETPPALVLAGAKGWDQTLEAIMAQVRPGMRLLTPGYLPLEDLPGFLAGADIVAYPSLGEGFGLPVLEAMSCGATVLTSRELSLPEVGGDSVAYCGTDVDSIARELAALYGDEPRRRALATSALERAATFTWERAARAHVDAFEYAISSRE